MKKVKVLMVLMMVAWVAAVPVKAEGDDYEFYKKTFSQPAYKLESYEFDPNTPLVSRVKKVPDFLLESIKKMDNEDNYLPYTPTEEEMNLIKEELGALPEKYKTVLQKRLIGIYFIDNLLGNGLADWIFDQDDNVYSYIAFNPRSLKLGINELVTNKENTCFINDDSTVKVSIDCGNELPGFVYILLHETSHLADANVNITPYVEPLFSEYFGFEGKNRNFVKNVWADYRTPAKKADFPYRSKITVYGFNNGPKIKLSNAKAVYAQFKKTPFASLYSTTNWGDDFADYFTYYHITQKLKQPYRITVKDNSGEFVYEPMKSRLVRKRFKIVEALYK
ncbi:MAG: hypothetical protein A2252_04895 [Elusimicrobia bacterium RIFOXYA2_FULL_39_19]|nr:MAG: hypothetical protein A2252_04895 [Elusimicrobia bacterium RIFOXYA2_FULL_39_19]